ncbi:hypothetical protein Tco_0719856 [Tanacetum coccineum]
MRVDPKKTQNEPIYRVVLDALALTTCYPSFLITTDVPVIYMQQFWVTINKHGSSYQFKIGKKRFSVDMEDDCILGTMRFISKDEDTQVYGALIPTVMTTPKIWDSPAYQTYLAFATGVITPKKKRIYKKPASPMIKTTTTSPKETPSKKKDTPDVSVSKKKAPKTTNTSKGIELLSDAALLEEAQLKKVPDEPKGKSSDTSDSGDEAIEQGDDEDVLESDDDHEHDDDEQDAIVEPDDEDKGDKEMTNVDAEHENVIQESAATTISSLLTSLFPHLQQSTPIPTPTEATTSTTAVPNSETLTILHQRISNLEKDVKELKDVDNSTKVISTIQSEVQKVVK